MENKHYYFLVANYAALILLIVYVVYVNAQTQSKIDSFADTLDTYRIVYERVSDGADEDVDISVYAAPFSVQSDTANQDVIDSVLPNQVLMSQEPEQIFTALLNSSDEFLQSLLTNMLPPNIPREFIVPFTNKDQTAQNLASEIYFGQVHLQSDIYDQLTLEQKKFLLGLYGELLIEKSIPIDRVDSLNESEIDALFRPLIIL